TVSPEVKDKKVAQGTVTLELLRQSVSDTPAPFYHALIDDLNQCLEEFKLLSQALGKRCGHDTPNASAVRGALQTCIDVVQQVAEQKLKSAPAPEAAASPSDGQAAATAAGTTPSGPIRSREDAFRHLEQVAAYFRTHEPHTVISYTL